jgi:hypothetical protein
MTIPREVAGQCYLLWRLEIKLHQPTGLFEIVSYNNFETPLEKEVAIAACETLANLEGNPGHTHFEALPIEACPGCQYPQVYLHTKECAVNGMTE